MSECRINIVWVIYEQRNKYGNKCNNKNAFGPRTKLLCAGKHIPLH